MNILQEFKKLAADTHNTTTGVKQDMLFDVAEFVHQTMQEHDISQREFAKRIGMKESQLSRILNTEANLTVSTVARIFWAFKCRPHITHIPEERAVENLIAENVIEFPEIASATEKSTYNFETTIQKSEVYSG